MAACMWKWVSCTTPGCCIPQCTPVPPKARGADNAPAAGGALRTGLCTQAREYPIPLFLVLPCVPGCDAITPVMHQNRGELPSAPSSTPYPKTPRAGSWVLGPLGPVTPDNFRATSVAVPTLQAGDHQQPWQGWGAIQGPGRGEVGKYENTERKKKKDMQKEKEKQKERN